jgi:hypothetical protein
MRVLSFFSTFDHAVRGYVFLDLTGLLLVPALSSVSSLRSSEIPSS